MALRLQDLIYGIVSPSGDTSLFSSSPKLSKAGSFIDALARVPLHCRGSTTLNPDHLFFNDRPFQSGELGIFNGEAGRFPFQQVRLSLGSLPSTPRVPFPSCFCHRVRASITRPPLPVTCIQFNPVDERYFISGSIANGNVRIWNVYKNHVVD